MWDVFSHTPGKVFEGHTGDVACDHYHRLPEDIQLMKELGLQGYRFSLSWPRLLPAGTGARNEKGFDFYNRLIDGLLEAGIKPCATLYHWDMPSALFDQGGWLSEDSPKWFEEYTEAAARAFGDRVKFWMTFNEPQVFVGLGHQYGNHAPGLRLEFDDIKSIIRNILLSHGRSVKVLRQFSEGCEVGMAPVGHGCIAATSSAADVEAARKFCFDHSKPTVWPMSVWLDPILDGGYRDQEAVKAGNLPDLSAEDLEIIAQPIDFVGLNTYFSEVAESDGAGGYRVLPNKVGEPQTTFKWYVRPESLYWVTRFFSERWPKTPIYFTENGLSNQDWVHLDGKVHDTTRIDFLHRYLRELRRAAGEGCDVRGYFQWSLMDNFEWAEGYRERFGLIHVDYQTLKRTPKDSYYWYREVIKANGANL